MLTLFTTSALATSGCPLSEAPIEEIQQLKASEIPQILDRAKGCEVLIEVWASWCAPCISIAPSMVDFHANNPQTQIISISADNTLGEMKRFIETHKVPGVQIHLTQWSIPDLEKVFATYGLSFPGRIPYLVLLSSKGDPVVSLTEPSAVEFNKLTQPEEKIDAPRPR